MKTDFEAREGAARNEPGSTRERRGAHDARIRANPTCEHCRKAPSAITATNPVNGNLVALCRGCFAYLDGE